MSMQLRTPYQELRQIMQDEVVKRVDALVAEGYRLEAALEKIGVADATYRSYGGKGLAAIKEQQNNADSDSNS